MIFKILFFAALIITGAGYLWTMHPDILIYVVMGLAAIIIATLIIFVGGISKTQRLPQNGKFMKRVKINRTGITRKRTYNGIFVTTKTLNRNKGTVSTSLATRLPTATIYQKISGNTQGKIGVRKTRWWTRRSKDLT